MWVSLFLVDRDSLKFLLRGVPLLLCLFLYPEGIILGDTESIFLTCSLLPYSVPVAVVPDPEDEEEEVED